MSLRLSLCSLVLFVGLLVHEAVCEVVRELVLLSATNNGTAGV